jgi:hypothetical protein
LGRAVGGGLGLLSLRAGRAKKARGHEVHQVAVGRSPLAGDLSPRLRATKLTQAFSIILLWEKILTGIKNDYDP